MSKNLIRKSCTFFAACLAIVLIPALAVAAPITWYVDAASTGGNGLSSASALPTISAAVASAASGDTIRIASGTYQENVVIDGKLLTLVGAGRGKTVIDGSGSAPCIQVTGADAEGTRITNLTLQNIVTGGFDGDGAGLLVDDSAVTVYFIDGAFESCRSEGDGVAVNGPVWVIRSLISRCWSESDATVVCKGFLGLFSSVIVGCGRGDQGWSTTAHCSILGLTNKPVVNCTFSHNSGAIGWCETDGTYSPTYVLRNCVFLGNGSNWIRQSFGTQYCFGSYGGALANGKHNIGGDKPETHPGEKWPTTFLTVISPFGDWRPIAGSDIVDAGSDSFLDLVPEEFRSLDYYGNPRKVGTVDMGAAEGAVELKSGIWRVASSNDGGIVAGLQQMKINGYRVKAATNVDSAYNSHLAQVLYFVSDSEELCTAQMTLDPVDPATTDVFGMHTEDFKSEDNTTALVLWSFPNQKGEFSWKLPPKDVTNTYTLVKAAGVKWVNPTGSDSNDGSKEAPYRTLQKAVDSVAEYGVVYAEKGTYAEGGELGVADNGNANTTTNRVYIGKRTRLVSVEGAEKTFIVGAKSASAQEGNFGCGPGAMRCVQAANYVPACVCGFTLTGGATDEEISGNVYHGNYGGGALEGFNWARDYQRALQAVDCIISNNAAYYGGAAYCAYLKSCVVADNHIAVKGANGEAVASIACPVAMKSVLSSCLVLNPEARSGMDSDTFVYDTTIIGGLDTSNSDWRNTCYLGTSSFVGEAVYGPVKGQYKAQAADFIAAAENDYRPTSVSQLLTKGAKGIVDDDHLGDHYIKYYAQSLDGIDYSPAGVSRGIIGCYRQPAPGRDLYVDASAADDSGNGLTAATAKKTLAGIMAIAHYGDVVHAAPGSYASGTMVNTVKLIAGDTDLLPSRVVVPAGVTLIADAGPETTEILGELTDGVSYKMGDDSVRGAYLMEGAVLEGFTLRRCSTKAGGGVHEYNCGACVVAPRANAANPAVIRNCILTDGHARSGAAGFGGIYERCRVGNCQLTSDGLLYYAELRNCLVLGNGPGGNMSMVRYHYGIYSSTLFAAELKGDADFNTSASAPIENSIVYCPKVSAATTIANAKNCILRPVNNLTIADSCTGTIETSSLDTVLDMTTYRPLAGSDAVDAGDMTLFAAKPSELDCGGGQRVRDARVDIGAYEYDNREEIGAKLARQRLVVSDADDSVAVQNNAVTFDSGELVVQYTGDKPRLFVNFVVNGTGTLVLADSTGVVGRYSAASGAVQQSWECPTGEVQPTLRLVYQPGTGEDAGVTISGINDHRLRGLALVLE